ncbi:MAG TPA: hypothetical protein VK762_31065 [Polyangiaceae bacterium]|nr:hypothetical protein [Polyangiaceae bacterium]
MAAGRRTNDPLRVGGVRCRAFLAAAALIVLALASMGACDSNDAVHGLGPTGARSSGTGPGACGPGAAGCACPKDGAAVSCGQVESKSGNYVTCSVGHSTCVGGTWGPCIGNHLVTRSMPNVALSITGVHVLSQPVACTNVCDPNGCMATQADPGDVDAAGVTITGDGGVTLQDAALNLDAGCVGLSCDVASCGGSLTTTLSGTVYDPAGNNPLYNAYVYIPVNPLDPLPPMGAGASCDTCGGVAGLAALQATQTDAAGNFTLTNVPTAPNLPVVVQMGKWRREVVLSTITSCKGNSIAGNCTTPDPADCVFRLPRNQNDGYDPVAGTYSKADLPQIAIVTGKSDPFDCLLLKAGIDPQEFGDYTSNKRIHFYQADGAGGGDSLDSAYGMNVPGSQLWSNLNPDAPMALYDAILLPCEGAAYDRQASGQTPYQNLISYVDSGGRVFTTHFGYTWLQYPAGKNYVPPPDNWASLADWSPTGPAMTSTVDTQDPLTGVVNTGFPKGAVYSQWLQNAGATTAPTQLTIHQGRQDLKTVGKGVQGWMTAQDTEYPAFPDYTNLFTFNTPLGAAANAQCGRVVYSDFHVSAGALVAPANQCLSDADCGFSATCQGATTGAVGQCNEPCGTSADCPNGSFACEGAATGTCDQAACARNSDCGTGRACVNKACACTSNSDCNGGGCGAMTCSPVSCSTNSQCGKGTCGGGKCTVSSFPCHANNECGLGSCGGAGRMGTCNAGGSCHSNATCGIGGTCGTGPGATPGTCTTSGGACHKNADCDSNSCGAGGGSAQGTCANGTAHACHANTDCDSGSCGAGFGGSATGVCGAGACVTNEQCGTGGHCNVATNTCTSGACSADANCGTTGGVCNGATCTSASCTGDAACPASALCSGATCSRAACDVDTDCTVAGSTCRGATCSASKCDVDTDCPAGSCSGATCTPPPTCAVNSDCGTGVGARCRSKVCSPSACTSSADCGAGSFCGGTCTPPTCTQNGDCASGICSGGTCGCTSGESCGGAQTCVGAEVGVCGRACTQNSDCAPDLCVGGQCGGCSDSSQCNDNAAAPTCTGVTPGNYGSCTPFSSNEFPEACRQGALSAQEKALEFMFFDLTSCTSPDNAAPPAPPVSITGYRPATFTQDFQAMCPPATVPEWREFDWQAQIPPGASIVLSAQSGATASTLLPAMPLLLATATQDTNTGPDMQNFDFAFIDTGTSGSGAFDVAMPPVTSGALLRVTITLNPTADLQQAPTLDQWKVQYDCVSAE